MPSIYSPFEKETFRATIEGLKYSKSVIYGKIDELQEKIDDLYDFMKKTPLTKEQRNLVYQKIQNLKAERTELYEQIKIINNDIDGFKLALRM